MDLGYSSAVVLTLVVGGMEIALSHVGSKCVILLEDHGAFPPDNAELIVTVDGNEDRQSVYLPHGILPGQQRVAYL